MPQFDPTHFPSEIIWTVISFVLLYLLLRRWVLPRIAAILEARRKAIELEFEAAHRQMEEAVLLQQQYAERLHHMDEEQQAMFVASEQRLIERREQLMREWALQVKRQKQSFRSDMAQARRQALLEIQAQSAGLVMDATGKLLHRHIDAAEAEAVLQEAIADLAQRTCSDHNPGAQ